MCGTRSSELSLVRPRIGKPSPKTVVVMGSGLIAFVAALYVPPVYAALGADAVTWVLNVVQVASALTLFSLAVRAWWTAERGELIKALAGSLALGLLLWTLGQAIYAYIQINHGPGLTGPTLADAFWVAGYIPLVAGLYLRLHTFALGLTRLRWSAIVGATLILATLATVFVVIPILERPNRDQPLMTIINLVYIAGDLVIVLTASLIVQSLARGAMSTPWALVAAGCLMFSTSDLMSAYGVWSGTPVGAGDAGITLFIFIHNILFLSSYVTAAVGAYWLARLHRVI